MPITDTGYQRRTIDVVLESIEEDLRAKISPKLDLSEDTVLGNYANIAASRIDELEQLVEEAYNAYDPDNASDDRQVALALISGVPRRGAQKGLVTATINVTGGHTYAPGDLAAHVVDEPTNRWLNRDEVTTTSGTHDYTAVFESQNAGAAAVAEAGTLTVIATPVDGWNSVTNAAAATPGQDLESVAALRIRREQSVAAGGSRTRGAIRAKLIAVDGVLSAEVFDNPRNTTDANGILPHGLRAVVWDGSPAAADDDEIAQVIYDFGPEGILPQGAEAGTARDRESGLPVTVNFDRAVTSSLTIAVDIESETGVAAADVKAAILAEVPGKVGKGIVYNRMSGAVFDVEGVDNWATFTINGGTVDLPAVQNLIYLLDDGNITVTGDVS